VCCQSEKNPPRCPVQCDKVIWRNSSAHLQPPHAGLVQASGRHRLHCPLRRDTLLRISLPQNAIVVVISHINRPITFGTVGAGLFSTHVVWSAHMCLIGVVVTSLMFIFEHSQTWKAQHWCDCSQECWCDMPGMKRFANVEELRNRHNLLASRADPIRCSS
jgi:hypothetical protein